MNNEISSNILDKFPSILVSNGAVIKISQQFIDMTKFTYNQLLNNNVEDLFKTLRISSDFHIYNIDEQVDYFFFNKFLDVKFVNIKVTNVSEGKVYIFLEKPNSYLDSKFPFANVLCSENYHGIGLFSLPDVTLLKANEKFISFFDEPYNKRGNCIGKRVNEFVTGFEGSASEKIWQKIIATGEAYNTDEYMFDRFERGVTYWKSNLMPIYENGKPKYCIEMTTDITEQVLNRKRLEEQFYETEIKNQKELLEVIIENMSDAVLVYNNQKNLTLLNAEARKMFPYLTLDTYSGIQQEYQCFDFEGNQIPNEMSATNRAFKGEIVKGYRVVLRRGSYGKVIEVNATPIFDDNNIVSVVLAHRDVTEQVEKQQQLLNAEFEKNKALQKSMEMKDDFLSLISHEFRTPLNVINSALQAMDYICSNELSDKAKKYLGMIKQNTFRQLRLVNNLLDITRIGAGSIKINKKNIDIVFLTNAIIESVHTYAFQKKVHITFKSSIKYNIIGIDDEKYERILLNLLSNAIKFTPEGRSISVKLASKKDSICVQVEDKGRGIPADKLDIIFDRFGQVDSSLSRQAEGTGIGLSLVKKFVEVLGGSISVKSKVGTGTTFTLMLPNETIMEEKSEKEMINLLNNRLVETTHVEFSDIYL